MYVCVACRCCCLLSQCAYFNILLSSCCRPAKRVKEARTWSDSKVTKALAEELNRSESVDASNNHVNGEQQVVDVSAHSSYSVKTTMRGSGRRKELAIYDE